MKTRTVNVAFQDDLLGDIDRVAKLESRSRSDFLREDARAYIERKNRWSDLFAVGGNIAAERSLTPADVEREIKAYRKTKAKSR